MQFKDFNNIPYTFEFAKINIVICSFTDESAMFVKRHQTSSDRHQTEATKSSTFWNLLMWKFALQPSSLKTNLLRPLVRTFKQLIYCNYSFILKMSVIGHDQISILFSSHSGNLIKILREWTNS